MQPSTIVPPSRLGQLLTEARLDAGHDLEALAYKSDGLFTVGELADIENGHRHLDDRVIESVTSLYSLDCGPIVPQRAELTIDLDRSLVSAAGRSIPIALSTRDHVLDRYLSLVYVLRNREPGTAVPLRQEDLDILAASLAERSELIEEQLLAAMTDNIDRIGGLAGWFRNRLWVPGAGALVGVVSIGALVMVSGGSTTDEPARTLPEPDPEPGTSNGQADVLSAAALVVEPAAPTAIEPETASTVETLPAPASTVAPSPTTSVAPTTTEAAPTNADAVASADELAVGRAAEALLPIDVADALPRWEIRYLGHNDSFRGLTFPYDKTIEVYVRDTDTPDELAAILAHEIGHAIDVQHLTAWERTQWKQARSINERPWWPTAYASDFQTGAGDFAEAFAFWAIGDESQSEIGGEVTPAQVALLESFLATYL